MTSMVTTVVMTVVTMLLALAQNCWAGAASAVAVICLINLLVSFGVEIHVFGKDED